MPRFLVTCLCLSWAWAAAVSAQAPRTNLGTLTCTLAESAHKQISPTGEERAIRCAFKPLQSGAEQTYTGSIRRVGQGEAPTGKLVMIWVVQGPPNIKLDPGLLEQTYVGAPERSSNRAATATLVGERNKDIVMRAETANEASVSTAVVTVMELKILSVPT